MNPPALRLKPGHHGQAVMLTDGWVLGTSSAWPVPAKLAQSQLAFAKMLTYANHLGLQSEQIGPTGELLVNFPQAFTHLGLIKAAIALDRPLTTRRAQTG